MSKQYRLLLADDHRIVIDGLHFLLSAEPQFEVVGAAENGNKVIEFIENNQVDLVILDINMPELDGIACAKKIKSTYPQVKIIILTQYTQKAFVSEVVKIVDGCIMKNNTGGQLIRAIHKVMGNEQYFDEFLEDGDKREPLGKREIEIIRLISEGLTSDQIAEKLFISIHTVKTHRKNILRKTGMHNTPDLIAFAINEQLI